MLKQLILDNPLLIRHVRARLRRPQAGYLTFVVLLLACCLLWAGYEADGLDGSGIFAIFFGCQALALHLAGTSQVASSISASNDSGILDFHRVSPLPSLTTTLGFVFGAPIREYLATMVIVPFAFLCALVGSVGIAGFISTGLALISTTMLFHSLAITAGLVSAPGKTRNINMGLGFLLIVSSFSTAQVYAGLPIPGLLTAGPALMEVVSEPPRQAILPTFFGLNLPLFVQSLLYQIPLTIFLLIAAVRRMASAQAMLYSKTTAVAFLVTICVLNLGGIIGHPRLQADWLVPMLVYLDFAVATLLILAVTPGHGAYVNGARRSRRIGMGHAPLWSDDSSNRAVAFVMAGLIPASVQLLMTAVPNMNVDERMWLVAGTAAAVVVYFALATQYFFLRFGRRGKLVLLMFLFLFWLLPMVLSGLAAMTFGNDAAELIASVSPLYGIGAGSWTGLIFAVVMSGVFFALLIREERGIWQQLLQREMFHGDEGLHPAT